MHDARRLARFLAACSDFPRAGRGGASFSGRIVIRLAFTSITQDVVRLVQQDEVFLRVNVIGM